MRGKLAFAAGLAAVFGGMLATAAAVVVLLGAGLPEGARAWLARLVADRAPALAFVALALLPVCGALVAWLVRRHVVAPHALAEQTRGLVAANPGQRVDAAGAPALRALAAEINRLAAAYQGAQGDSAEQVADAASRLEEERNRLAAVMADLSQAVLLCNADGRILLYNERARALLGTPTTPVGLGRSVFGVLDRDELVHALDKLQHAVDQGAASPSVRFVSAVPSCGLVRVQMAPFLDAAGGLAGVVLAIEDVSRYAGHEFQRRPLMHALAARFRAPTATIRAAAENMVAFPEMDAAQRERFARIIAEESLALSRNIDAALGEHAAAIGASMSLEDMRAADLVALALPRIGAHVRVEAEDPDPGLWLRVDSFALLQSLVHLARRLREERAVDAVELRAGATPSHAELDLAWRGDPVPDEVLAAWEAQPMTAGAAPAPLTLRDVLERHDGEIWQEREAPSGGCRLRMLLPLGEPVPERPRAAPRGESRPEYYDFDLFRSAGTRGLDDQPLATLACTVFDTETTGLEPSAGDEIVSLGAVRIVNGRLLKTEVYDQLVDPRRPINPASRRIHGIDASLLASQPTLAEVLPAFHRFCEDTVLVAHNAAFDMRFLELKEAETGLRFDQPVLDTLLLSALVHPSVRDHSLEAIAGRLGVRVIGRHTALGDALLTGEIFLKLLPLLAERGIDTLARARDASQRTWQARLRY